MKRKKPEDVVPPEFGKLFSRYEFFNAMQSALVNDLLNSDKSMVISAPTGSGKTVAFELAIVRMLENAKIVNTNNNILPKAIYIAPIKALCSEKFNDWKPRFNTVNVNCTQLTGDTESASLSAIRQAQVVITTPEKWDSLTRRWRDFEQLLPAVQLFIVDEVHLLNENTRGPILEAVVARMKSSGVKRFIVASATIPNVEDLTCWIRGNGNANGVVQHVFNEMQRPVPLEKHVIGFNWKLRGFQFDMRLNYQLSDILRKYAEDKASLVFCNSRKSAEMAAFNLNKSSSVFSLNENQKSYLMQLAPRLSDVKLRKLVENGIAYHHAGLQYTDRDLIETSFRQGFLMVLISTSTLAMGINLPAHLVVIKSTETYSCGAYTEYSENMILQMIGRAGRPQFDTKGIAVILTQQKYVKKYQQLMNGQAPIESHLHKNLTEHLNSEISLNTITSLEMAMNWIRSTYLYIRSVRNPKHYGFDSKLSTIFVERKLEELCLQQIKELNNAGLVTFNPLTGLDVKTTFYGKLMAKYYICFETMKIFQQLKGKETLEDLINLLVQCKEMNEFSLRVNEKKTLNEMNKTPIRFPIKGRIKTNEEKISCIIQAVLGNIEITAPNLIQESLKIMRIGDRISKCLLEYVRFRIREEDSEQNENGWYSAILNAVIMAKCMFVKLWENTEYAVKQLNGIGTVYAEILVKYGKTTLKSIAQTEARTLENILNKSAPFGDKILENLMNFPEYQLKLERKSKYFVQVTVKQVNENYVHKNGITTLFILGDSNNKLLHFEENVNDSILEFTIYERLLKINKADEVNFIYGHVIHLNLVGVDTNATLEINAPKTQSFGANISIKPKKQSRLNVTIETFKENSFMNDNDNSYNINNTLLDKSTVENINIITKDESLKPLQNFKKFHFNMSKMKKVELPKTDSNEIYALVTSSADENITALMTINDLDEKTLNATERETDTTINETLKANEHLNASTSGYFNSTTDHCLNANTFNESIRKHDIAQSDRNATITDPTTFKCFENNNITWNTTKLNSTDNDCNTTTTNSVKQLKVTDFFSKCKNTKKIGDPKYLTKSFKVRKADDSTKSNDSINYKKNIFVNQMKPPTYGSLTTIGSMPQKEAPAGRQGIATASTEQASLQQWSMYEFKRPAAQQQANEEIKTTPKKSPQTHITEQDIFPGTTNPKIKCNSSVSSYHSSSDDIPITAIPNPKQQIIVQHPLNTIKTQQAQRCPFTLASFLIDPNELNNSGPMIKITSEPKIPNIFTDKSNNSEHHSIDILKEMILKNRKEQNMPRIKKKTKFFDNRKSFKLSELINDENIKPNSKKVFQFINSQDKMNKQEQENITPKIIQKQNYATSKSSYDSKTDNFNIKNQTRNMRKRLFENNKPENSYEKLLNEESLLDSYYSSSPLTQNSPMDLSKGNKNIFNNNKNKRPKLKDAATQVNFQFESNKTEQTQPVIENVEFWYKVALEFRKLPAMQTLSLENFKKMYKNVQQKTMPPPAINNLSSKKVSTDQPTNSKLENSSNLKIKNRSTFRLQLFADTDDEEKALEEVKLKRRKIKLINENVMNLVLERKCEEISKTNEELNQKIQIQNEFEKLERELGISIDHDDIFSIKNFKNNDNNDDVGQFFFP